MGNTSPRRLGHRARDWTRPCTSHSAYLKATGENDAPEAVAASFLVGSQPGDDGLLGLRCGGLRCWARHHGPHDAKCASMLTRNDIDLGIQPARRTKPWD